jgi:hypothetical protein
MEELTRQQGKERPDPQKQGLVIDFVAGGAYMLLTHWIMNGRPDSAENMGDLLFELTATCELHDAPGSTAV